MSLTCTTLENIRAVFVLTIHSAVSKNKHSLSIDMKQTDWIKEKLSNYNGFQISRMESAEYYPVSSLPIETDG